MDSPAKRLRLPDEIRSKTIAFFNWYINDIHIHHPPYLHRKHVENDELSYDWRPRDGFSRLTLTHLDTGYIAMNAFAFRGLRGTDPATLPPPPSLLITTWLDLCSTLEWISEGARASMAEQMNEIIAHDVHLLGEPIYGERDDAGIPPQ